MNEVAVISLNTMYFYDSNKGELGRIAWFLPLFTFFLSFGLQRFRDAHIKNGTIPEISNWIG